MIAMEPELAASTTRESAQAAAFAIARVGGVSATLLEGLTLETTLRHIDAALGAAAAMADLTGSLEAALYALVPHLDHDQNLRRRVLALKRDIHNQRATETTAEDVRSVAAALTGDIERFRFEEWFRLASERETALASARESCHYEVTEASRRLANRLEDSVLEQGLAIASPDLLADLHRARKNHQDKDWNPSSKLSRSCLSYVSRAALKTSPLSTFTQISLAAIGAGKSSVSGIPDQSGSDSSLQPKPEEGGTFYVLKMLPHAWLMLLARSPEFTRAFQYEAYTGISRASDETKVRVLTTRPRRSGTFVWRHEEMREQEFDANLHAILRPGRRFSYDELVGLVNTEGSLDTHAPVVSLMDRHRIQPVAPYARREARPLLPLADALAALNTEAAQKIASSMRELQHEVDQGAIADGGARLMLLSRVRRIASEIYAAVGAPAPDWLDTGKLLFEDVAFHGPAITLPEQVREDLTQAAEKYREGTIRSKLYDYLYLYFIRKFGPNGETRDILGFLFDFLGRGDFNELLARAIAEDKLAVKEPGGHARSHLPAGESSIPPTLTIFFQIAADSREALQRGDYQLVVNQVNSGEGGLLGRFGHALGSQEDQLRSGLNGWLRLLYEGRSPVELPVCGDSHNLQGTQGVCGRILQWPAEIPTTEAEGDSVLRLDQLRLRARADGTLDFADEQGQTVGITYQGVVPPYLAPQALRLLMLIADPWIRDYSPLSHDAPGQEQKDQLESIQFSPRQQEGRVVMQRARWRIPSNLIITRNKGEDDFSFFLRAQRWRNQYGIPEEVFARVDENRLSFRAKERKPVWIHFGSPHALELLSQLADTDAALTLTEVLPARKQHWVAAGESGDSNSVVESRASEFMGLVRWPMPRKAASGVVATPRVPAKRHSPGDWIYLNIYPRHFDQLDQVIQKIIHPALREACSGSGLERWFFIRYADQRGWHIRLRLRGVERARENWVRDIGQLVDTILPGLEDHQPIHRLIPLTGPRPEHPAEAGYALAAYEPEYEKYGGALGLTIAEELFQASSELTVKALLRVQKPSDRFLLTVGLTRSLVWQFNATGADRRRFLEHYLWYWSGQDRSGAANMRQKLRDAARQRRTFISQQLSELANHPFINSLIQEQEADLNRTRTALEAAQDEVTESPRRLSFDYLHMNNNRLGVLPSEEAYLAALLLESL
jgi:thiopeptide-type bacteriocin biosynthesis protein